VTAGPFRRVLVGWDASADAAEALCAAAALVGAGAGHVVALTVVQAVRAAEAADEQQSERAAVRRRAEESFERIRDTEASGTRMSLQIVEASEVGKTVCAYAAEHGFDLLILGRHGDGRSLRARLGRVAETAVRGSDVPVLLLSAP
jgi:nucleotide-binding universal stress UspA family protein